MRSNNRVAWVAILSAGLALGACGGEDLPPAGAPGGVDPGQPAATTTDPGPETTAQAVDPGLATVLSREVFSYQGAGRDPFESLLRSGDVRPLLEDLRVTSINYDNQFPMNSVAVIRDTTESQRYAVRVGDQLGRLRVSSIRAREVVLAYEEFGRELQDTLRLRRNQEGSQ